MLKEDDKNNNHIINNIENYSVESLNYYIENYYFKYMFNIFSFKKQENKYLLKYLKGYIYYRYIFNIIYPNLSPEHFTIFHNILDLYTVSNFNSIQNENLLVSSYTQKNILSENNIIYSLDFFVQENITKDSDNLNKYVQPMNECNQENETASFSFEKFKNIKEAFKNENIT